MTQAALVEPRTIKISSKRQITIPASAFKKLGFGEYALLTETEDGLLLQPVDVGREDVSVDLLSWLIENGFEGQELLEEYKRLLPVYEKLARDLDESRRAVAEGRVMGFEEFKQKVWHGDAE